MRVTDSPIGGELLRQGRELAASLAASKAGAELNVGQAQEVFAEGVRQFQANLRQQAFQNRLALTGSAAQAPLLSPSLAQLPTPQMAPVFASGLPLAGFEAITPQAGLFAQERIAGAPTVSRTRASTWPGTLEYIKAFSGVAAAGIGALAMSSATLKKDLRPLDPEEFRAAGGARVLDMSRDDEYEKARKTMRGLPIARYRYKWEPDTRTPHIGVIAEMSPDEIREGPLRINLMDVAGLTLAAVKGVDRRIDRLEAHLPVRAA